MNPARMVVGAETEQRDAIFTLNSVELIRDVSGLYGNDLANVMHANPGDDVLRGNGGADLFVFAEGYQDATITDFTPGLDKVQLDDQFFGPDVLSHATPANADVVITDLNGHTIRLLNIELGSLAATDFMLA